MAKLQVRAVCLCGHDVIFYGTEDQADVVILDVPPNPLDVKADYSTNCVDCGRSFEFTVQYKPKEIA